MGTQEDWMCDVMTCKKVDDMRGKRFGRLTALEPTSERKNGYTVWRCKCDCGGEILVPSRSLKRGWTTNCGCMPKVRKHRDLTGERFGRLIVLKEAPGRNEANQICWECRCDCGKTVDVTSGMLVAGYKKSCGCLSRLDPDEQKNHMVGRRFGSLTVLSYDGKRGGKHYWKCLCSCGKETVVSNSNLKNRHTQSCGCMASPVNTMHFVEGTCIEGIRSKKTYASNTSGVRGVYRNEKTGQWVAQITFQGKTKYLGSFAELEDAAKARARGEELFDDFLEKHGCAVENGQM